MATARAEQIQFRKDPKNKEKKNHWKTQEWIDLGAPNELVKKLKEKPNLSTSLKLNRALSS